MCNIIFTEIKEITDCFEGLVLRYIYIYINICKGIGITQKGDAGWPRCTVPYTMYGTGFFVYGTVRNKVGVYGILACTVFFRL